MKAKGFNNSDLARLVWGEAEDAKGYKVARNRDRIGVYLAGKSFPEARTLAEIAKCLDMTPDKLAPEITTPPVDRKLHEIALNRVGDRTHVQINALLPPDVALEVVRLITKTEVGEAASNLGEDAS